MNQAIRYLEWCVADRGSNVDPAILNYLVSLYAKLPDDSALMTFLQRQGDTPLYDRKYALRLCIQEGKKRACVIIYSSMHLYAEAVELALTVDLELAMEHAMPEDSELRKKLWLRIARHVVKEERDISKFVRAGPLM